MVDWYPSINYSVDGACPRLTPMKLTTLRSCSVAVILATLCNVLVSICFSEEPPEGAAVAAPDVAIDFAFDVRPILSDKCFFLPRAGP